MLSENKANTIATSQTEVQHTEAEQRAQLNGDWPGCRRRWRPNEGAASASGSRHAAPNGSERRAWATTISSSRGAGIGRATPARLAACGRASTASGGRHRKRGRGHEKEVEEARVDLKAASGALCRVGGAPVGLFALAWLLLVLAEVHLARAGARLVSRQAGASWRQNEAPALGNQLNVPYKAFYVTRACEWKSNLFVPKSNDIHFAQPSSGAAGAPEEPLQSSVVYETLGGSSQLAVRTQGGQQDGSRTMLSTDSRALILALPIMISQSFAGYEPACSIRLIVPRNMRILAELTSRRLAFAEERLQHSEADGAEQRTLWLNVSQNQFIETEHKSFESEGNVLAFRFLFERFASRQLPDTRFQVVLTAFQTLSENSDLSGLAGHHHHPPPPYFPARPAGESSGAPFQFICDQQRLISTNLACDGFKNCQDGQDEEPTTCLALRGQNQPDAPVGSPPFRNQLGSRDSTPLDSIERPSIWVRVWNLARDTNSLAGFFFGFLLVLILLTCCACCSYLGYLFWQYQRRRALSRRRRAQLADEQESDSLAAQNAENAARLKQAMAKEPARLVPPPRLQSILKKPGALLGQPQKGPTGRPAEPPPSALPLRPARGQLADQTGAPVPLAQQRSRGALSSSLSHGGGQQAAREFKPTPAKRLTRPTRPVPMPDLLSPSSASNATATTTTTIAGANSAANNTGTQRITTYHYSSGSTRLSETYLQRLAERSRPTTAGPARPPAGQNTNYQREPSVSPQSSLI